MFEIAFLYGIPFRFLESDTLYVGGVDPCAVFFVD